MTFDRNRLIELREEKGFTQYELANAAGITVMTLNKIETSEEAKPLASTLKKIALALGVDIDEFKEESDIDRIDEFGNIDIAIEDRAKVINNIIEIDSFMFSYISKQLEIFKRDLGRVFGISDKMLLEAALFSGVSWSRPGNTTHESNYPKVLGDLLALQNEKIEIERVDIKLHTLEEIDKYRKIPGVYGICSSEGELIRIGQTKEGIAERLTYHRKALASEEYPTMKEYISSRDVFGKDYYFVILAFEPRIGRKLTALQSDTWRYYAETKLIIEEKTYLKGNRHKEKGVFTGDIYIPIKIQNEMIEHYYGENMP